MNEQLQLSEAIRLGAMLRPQVKRSYFREGGSCALGAALESTGMNVSATTDREIAARWPICDQLVQCPVFLRPYLDKLGYIIVELNDVHGWTREAIADWVATIEVGADDAVIPTEEVTHA
jgi:hypothetical protein